REHQDDRDVEADSPRARHLHRALPVETPEAADQVDEMVDGVGHAAGVVPRSRPHPLEDLRSGLAEGVEPHEVADPPRAADQRRAGEGGQGAPPPTWARPWSP